MTYILGINSFHADASAALIKNGEVILASEEERFNRIKHSAGFPKKAIIWCLKEANISIKEIGHIAINTSPKAHFLKKIIFTIRNRPNPKFVLDKLKLKMKKSSIENYLSEIFSEITPSTKIHFIEHHLAHMASAFYASPFNSSCVISVDGFGDFSSTAWGDGDQNKLTIDDQVFFPHSLGIFYTAITQYLGFPNYGDEYKVMGLAPYGENKYENELSKLIKLKHNGKFELDLSFFNHSSEWRQQQWSEGSPKLDPQFSPNLINLLGRSRAIDEPIEKIHMDIAKSTQIIYENTFFHILNNLYNKYKNKNIALAGGCAANSVANGKITVKTNFKRVYIQAAPGDAGGAIGAALVVWNKIEGSNVSCMNSPFLGDQPKNNEIKNLLENKNTIQKLNDLKCNVINFNSDCNGIKDLLEKVSDEIIKGKVIGWFEGRMEWGPRALGHRSIIADPRRNDMKEILNIKIKKRESFRPFAPSILQEEIVNWFETNSEFDIEVPFMMKVYTFKESKRSLVPAVCHVDGTGRLQSVNKKLNGNYYELIKLFYKKTGVPILLNTSFNENEPIVRTSKEALDCFLRTKMDLLVLENYLIIRN